MSCDWFFAGTKPLQQIEVTIAKIVIGLVGLWLIAWTPYALVALIGISGNGHLLTPLVTMIPALFAKSAACIDPFVYSLNHPKIKAELFSRFRRLFVSSPRDANPFSESEHNPGQFRDRRSTYRSNHSRSYNRDDDFSDEDQPVRLGSLSRELQEMDTIRTRDNDVDEGLNRCLLVEHETAVSERTVAVHVARAIYRPFPEIQLIRP